MSGNNRSYCRGCKHFIQRRTNEMTCPICQCTEIENSQMLQGSSYSPDLVNSSHSSGLTDEDSPTANRLPDITYTTTINSTDSSDGLDSTDTSNILNFDDESPVIVIDSSSDDDASVARPRRRPVPVSTDRSVIVVDSSSDDDASVARPRRRQTSLIARQQIHDIRVASGSLVGPLGISRNPERNPVDHFNHDMEPVNNLFPLPEREINQIPTLIISREHLDNNLQCSICLENFIIDENVKKLHCSHLFHEYCIIPWLKQCDSCPICRGSSSSTASRPRRDFSGIVDGHYVFNPANYLR